MSIRLQSNALLCMDILPVHFRCIPECECLECIPSGFFSFFINRSPVERCEPAFLTIPVLHIAARVIQFFLVCDGTSYWISSTCACPSYTNYKKIQKYRERVSLSTEAFVMVFHFLSVADSKWQTWCYCCHCSVVQDDPCIHSSHRLQQNRAQAASSYSSKGLIPGAKQYCQKKIYIYIFIPAQPLTFQTKQKNSFPFQTRNMKFSTAKNNT